MSDNPPTPRSDADAELQRQIRADRPFSLSEAIGRLAGTGCMKGASPVDRRKQAVAEIQSYLTQHLSDPPGALGTVLLRHITESDLLLAHLDAGPLVVLAQCVRQLLDSDCRLKELVREADAEWGRVYDERPCFDKGDCPPHPDDPYTLPSVRATLTQLTDHLATGPT